MARFIPAGAGNTGTATGSLKLITVHPRWRGEHIDHGPEKQITDGSSPLARGTPHEIHEPRPIGRFIPAGAGNTPEPAQPPGPRPVHPRWRGEHDVFSDLEAATYGSSPLARGTPHIRSRCNRQGRFIPAGAGNTAPTQER